MRKILEVDGIGVIEQEPARGDHFKTGKTVTYDSIAYLLLADGTERYACLGCSDTPAFEQLRSTISHTSAHVKRRSAQLNQTPKQRVRKGQRVASIRRPRTDQDTINLVLDLVGNHMGDRQWAFLVSTELNRRGVPTSTGKKWTNNSVTHIWNTYGNRTNENRASTPLNGDVNASPVSPQVTHGVTLASLDHGMQSIERSMVAIQKFVHDTHVLQTMIADAIVSVKQQIEHQRQMITQLKRSNVSDVDINALRRKADKYDEIVKQFGL